MNKRKAFTLVELLVVIAIIALLVSILLPAVGHVRNRAKEGATKAAFAAYSTGLEQFRNDHDKYPKSAARVDPGGTNVALNPLLAGDNAADCYTNSFIDIGAHRLAEALFGADLLGYSAFLYEDDINFYKVDARAEPVDDVDNPIRRYGPYAASDNSDVDSLLSEYALERVLAGDMDLQDAPIFKGALAPPTNNNDPVWTNPNPVILDPFSKRRPFLYYRAHKSERFIHRIYDYADNEEITSVWNMDNGPGNDGYTGPAQYGSNYKDWAYFIWDQKTGRGNVDELSARPYRADSFILISAGVDGEFGTEDDITNFQRRD